MKKPTILGLLLVGLVAYATARCAGYGSGGTDASVAVEAGNSKNCNAGVMGPLSDDGGLTRIASSDPSMRDRKSVV